MAQSPRPMLHLRLSGADERDGEVPLADLARVAEGTQCVVTRIARGMIDDRGPGRLRQNVANVTTLFLIGLRSGSTILDIALPRSAEETLSTEGLPVELGELALTVLVESLDMLSEDGPAPVLPVGVDDRAVQDIDLWLRVLRGYQSVTIDAELSRGAFRTEITPRAVRKRLRGASSQTIHPVRFRRSSGPYRSAICFSTSGLERSGSRMTLDIQYDSLCPRICVVRQRGID